MTNTRTKHLLIGAVAIAAVGIGAQWLGVSRAAANADAAAAAVALQHDGARVTVPDNSPLRRSLAVEAIAERPVEVPFTLPAVVEADPAKLVKVLPPITGRIVGLEKRLGDTVKTGDALFTIDSADFAQAISDAAKARAALALTKRNIERQHELAVDEIAAQRDIEQAQSDYEQAASEAARAEARLTQLGLTGAHRDSHLLTLRSPIAGRVVDLNGALGGYWNDTTAPIMTVADLSTVFVTASAQEKDLGQLFVGQTATIQLDAYPNQPLTAAVRYIGELLDPDTRTVKVRMAIDNAAGQLKPGMFAAAHFLGQAHSSIVIPLTAVVQSGFYSRAFVEVAPWQFEARVLELGSQIDDHIEVVSGLKAGEHIVTKDGVLLND